jgi:hypothetical protein
MIEQATSRITVETVYYEGERGWMAEVRFAGLPSLVYGPYADKHDAQLWAQELGKRTVDVANKIKADMMARIDQLDSGAFI